MRPEVRKAPGSSVRGGRAAGRAKGDSTGQMLGAAPGPQCHSGIHGHRAGQKGEQEDGEEQHLVRGVSYLTFQLFICTHDSSDYAVMVAFSTYHWK